MSRINSYLTFNGNCRQAMTFYKDCLGGEFMFQTICESPLSEKMHQQMKDFILHSTLSKDEPVLLATDITPSSGLIKGNTVSLSLDCKNEIRTFYQKLSARCKADHPMVDTFWGALFGGLTDKFGIHWLLNYHRNEKSQTTTRP